MSVSATSGAPPPPTGERLRLRVRVEGTVQGVGFRPHVYRLAHAAGLDGFVRNDERGVLLELEGDVGAIRATLARLAAAPPPLAAIERMTEEPLPATGEEGDGGFAIVESGRTGEAAALVTADSATCADCLAELFDPADRRYRYPFVNCTNCGPRFSIVRGVPYDRWRTTMAEFVMCERCRAEYEDPGDRRFHAEPNACPVCGPRLALAGRGGIVEAHGDAALAGAVAALLRGEIVAVKGLGGFHLACRADAETSVAALRGRKHREDKPFALMVATLDDAGELVHLTAESATLLSGRVRPIVLAPRRSEAPIAPSVAPGRVELGLMLPYTPLHHLLLRDLGVPLVLTSGNLSDEPIAFRDDDALERLAGVADRFLLHDRPIAVRTDDSVVRTVVVGGARRTLVLRRSRGFAPQPVALPVATPRPLLACGAELKNTFCVAKGAHAWQSHHLGDLSGWETRRAFREGVAHFRRLFDVEPEIVAHDLHPDYASTALALAMDGVETVGVQHHHAHLAATLADLGEYGPAIGVVYDGTGYGSDGAIWGGELLVGDLERFERAGHLLPTRLPGGERAVREPWRMACAWSLESVGDDEPPGSLANAIGTDRWRAVARLAASGVASPLTTSVGRLFDAVAALAGVRSVVTHEGQAAIELEALADPGETGSYEIALVEREGQLVLDPRPAILEILADLARGATAPAVSARFHRGLAAVTVEAAARLAARRGIDGVALTGGVFQNRRLLEAVAGGLVARGLRPLVGSRVPPNDGGIALGQAAIAAARAARAERRA